MKGGTSLVTLNIRDVEMTNGGLERLLKWTPLLKTLICNTTNLSKENQEKMAKFKNTLDAN